MALLDAEWLAEKGRTIRPTMPGRALYDRLKFVGALVTDAPLGTGCGARLLWRNERGDVMAMALPTELVIGRDADCGLMLANPRVSRRHCKTTLLHGVAWLSDLGSTNGTIHNGVRMALPVPLRDGDLIEIGGDVLAFIS